ncbi:glycosyltransferase [candidate division KSB1 bacterium]|nr:glycosyltransferase [candidate division KSB1 bacterium]
MKISIIIPVLNEAHKIAADIRAAAEYLISNQLDGEIIIVDDGSADNTVSVAEQVSVPKSIGKQVVSYSPHRGKGYAIRTGMDLTSGTIVMFIDSGSCIPWSDAAKGITLVRSGVCDIAHASRQLDGSVILRPQATSRCITSLLFRVMLKIVMRVPKKFTDTQCGLKIYRGEIGRRLYRQCVTDGFMFDVEVILRALDSEYRIQEFPVTWQADPDSRLAQMKVPLQIARELVAIKRALSTR